MFANTDMVSLRGWDCWGSSTREQKWRQWAGSQPISAPLKILFLPLASSAVKRYRAAIWGCQRPSLKPRVWVPLTAPPQNCLASGLKSPFICNVPFILANLPLKVTSSRSPAI